MSWRTAGSLLQLRDEFNAKFPGRSKRSDGTVGDRKHRSRASRHNPNQMGVVTAMDLTHDPAKGADVHAWARAHVKAPHPELEYIISNGEVASRSSGWKWRKYRGRNPHSVHIHVAVGRGPDSQPQPPYDSRQTWGVADLPNRPDDDMELVKNIQHSLQSAGFDPGPIDGDWGPRTEAAFVAALKGAGTHSHTASVKLS